VFRNHPVFIAAQFFQYGQEALFTAVAERERNISPQAVETRALHRRPTEYFTKLFHAQASQPPQIRIYECNPRLKLRRLG
jgi:hypothetical protein